MNNLNSINNNGVPYYFPADIAKEGDQYVRISNFFKTRVGDNGKVLPFKWYDQGRVMNVHEYIPFIKGLIGQFSTDDNDEVIMASDASYREWQGSTANAHDGGFMDYILEDQMFPKEGIFKGHFGLKDGNGNVLTSVNIIFEVLGNDLRVGETIKYYLGDLENLKNQYKIQGEQAVKDFNAQIEAGTATDRQSLDALRASIQANRDGQASIAEQQASIIRQIKDNDIVTVAKQQADINEISQAINNRLSQLHNGPVAIENADTLKSKYPQGSDGTFLTLDTNHIWIWLNNQWKDAGEYQAAGLSQQAQQAIENTRSIVLGNELISNGSFGTGKTDPAIPWTGDTHLAVQKWSNRNWLQISSDGNSPFKGVQWNLNNSDKTYFDNPLQLDFDIRSLENKNIYIYVIFYDESGQRLAVQDIDKLNLTAGKYTHYQNVIYLDQSQRNCAYVALQIIQNSTDTIRQIIITGVSLHEIYTAKIPSSNLLALDNAQPNYPEITSLSTDVTNNKRWLTIKSTGGKEWAGPYWDIPVVQDMPNDPFKLEFDLRGDDVARTWNITIKGWNNAGVQNIDMHVDDIYVDINQIVHISRNILFPQQVADCASLQVHITTPDTKPVSDTKISDLSLTLVSQTVNNGNNLLNLLFAHINEPEITSLSVDTSNNKQWLTIKSAGGKQWAGPYWDIPVVQDMPNDPFKLEFDLRGDDVARTWGVYIKGFDNASSQNIDMPVDDIYVGANQTVHISRNILFPQQVADCAKLQLHITTPDTKPLSDTKISDLSLTLVPKTVNVGNNLLNLLFPHINIPEITSLSVDTSNNKQWLTIKSAGGKQWAGPYWDIPVVQDMPNDPFKLEFDLRGDDVARTWGVYIKGFDNAGSQNIDMPVDDIYVGANQIVHISRDILFPQQVADCAKLQLHITTPDTKPVSGTKISDLSLTLVPQTVNNGNNLLNLLFPHINEGEITSLSVDTSNNKQWLTIKSAGGKQWAGPYWDIPVVQDMPNDPFKLEFDLRGDDVARTWGVYIKGFDNAGSQNIDMPVDDIYVGANQTVHISRNILFPQQVADCAKLQLHITTPDTKPVSGTKISDLSLTLVPKTVSNDATYNGLPIMDIKGDLTAMTQDNAKNITWTFIDAHQTLNGYGTLKWQGNSSLNFKKKSYRLKTLTSDFQKKDKVKFKASWSRKSKFNLKAYYTDGLLSRDPVNADIGGAVASSRRDSPNDLVEEDNFGLIQGFPIILTLNGKYAGLYSLNTTRPDFDYTKFAIMGGQYNALTTFQETNPSVKLDGTDFESLNPEDTPTDEEKQAVNALIQFISTSSDDDFKTKLSDHISVNSAIDYLIFNNIIGNRDGFAKNQIYLSWDGTHWYLQAYDLDDSYQGGWDGKVFEAPTDIIGTDNKLFARLNTLFSSQIKNRYQEIRTWLTPDYVLNKYKNRIDKIGVQNYQREYEKWDNPAKDTEDFAQLRKAVYTQFKLLDSKWMS